MAQLIVGKSLADTDVLWRYMPLDKFIDLVSTKTLFFAPLAWYAKSDPFEGYLPSVALDVFASISRRFRDEHLQIMEKLFSNVPEARSIEITKLRDDVEGQPRQMMALFKNMVSCLMVNCWYRSDHESEGMWGLYSKEGVAVRTSVGALRAALAGDVQQPVVHLGAVKYLDFSDRNLVASDCVTDDGQLMGMIKRVAYAHEKEVRMYVTDDRPPHDLTMHAPASTRIPVNVDALVEGVMVSPLASGALEDAVKTVCRWAKLDERLVTKSKLLEDCEALLDVYN